MKREFLLNLKVGDQPLSKEVIDAIMEENGRDIEAAKKPYSDYDDLKGQLATANTTIEQLQKQQDPQMVDGKTAQQWKDAHDQLVNAHKEELDGIHFQHDLDAAITAAKGRNTKAITAMLDVKTLRESEDKPAAIKAALEDLKKESGYLFDTEGTPPPYAPGTGSGKTPPSTAETLAGALQERYNK